MKTWQLKGDWLHNRSGKTHPISFLVICPDNTDPLKIVQEKYDLGGMTYLRGEVKNISDSEDATALVTDSDIMVLTRK